METTLKSTLSSAALCRRNGWEPGTLLIGDEGYGPTVIEITAVGQDGILAIARSNAGRLTLGSESPWTLSYRDWKPACCPMAKWPLRDGHHVGPDGSTKCIWAKCVWVKG